MDGEAGRRLPQFLEYAPIIIKVLKSDEVRVLPGAEKDIEDLEWDLGKAIDIHNDWTLVCHEEKYRRFSEWVMTDAMRVSDNTSPDGA